MRQADQSAPFLKALFYGQPGSTKTRTACTATFVKDFSPVLVLEAAGNPLSVRDYQPQPTIFSMEKLKDYNQVYDFLVKDQPTDHAFRTVCESAGIPLEDYYRTVVLDGATQVQRFAFDVVLPGSDVEPGNVPAPYEIQHFGRVLGTMANWAEKYIKTLNMHVIVTALEDEHQSMGSSEVKIRPLLWGQSRGEICGYPYLVMRLAPTSTIDNRSKAVFATEIETAQRSQFVGFTRATNAFYAKDQYGMRDDGGQLMRYMFDPTIEKIWDRIMETTPQ